MNKRILGLLFFIAITFASCVPTQDLIYLQNKGNSNEIPINQLQNKPYRLQTSDILSVTIKAFDPKLVEIFNKETGNSNAINEQVLYYNGYSVDDHGNIRMPLLGELNVLGYTIDETREKIEKLLLQDHFKKESGLYVEVKLAGLRYTVNGEVNAPGSKIVYQDKINILQAVANSGDITVTGDRKDVKVFRQYPQGTEILSIDLTDASKAMNSPCYYLQPNDYVYVKPLKQKSWGTGKTGIESLSTLITILSLATTTFLLLKKIMQEC